jgi:hypothetical protein
MRRFEAIIDANHRALAGEKARLDCWHSVRIAVSLSPHHL